MIIISCTCNRITLYNICKVFGFNLSKGMLSPNFLLFKLYKHFNKGSHLLLALVNVIKNVGGPNCQIIAKTSFFNQLR
jgi:hypothetical protein